MVDFTNGIKEQGFERKGIDLVRCRKGDTVVRGKDIKAFGMSLPEDQDFFDAFGWVIDYMDGMYAPDAMQFIVKVRALERSDAGFRPMLIDSIDGEKREKAELLMGDVILPNGDSTARCPYHVQLRMNDVMASDFEEHADSFLEQPIGVHDADGDIEEDADSDEDADANENVPNLINENDIVENSDRKGQFMKYIDAASQEDIVSQSGNDSQDNSVNQNIAVPQSSDGMLEIIEGVASIDHGMKTVRTVVDLTYLNAGIPKEDIVLPVTELVVRCPDPYLALDLMGLVQSFVNSDEDDPQDTSYDVDTPSFDSVSTEHVLEMIQAFCNHVNDYNIALWFLREVISICEEKKKAREARSEGITDEGGEESINKSSFEGMSNGVPVDSEDLSCRTERSRSQACPEDSLMTPGV